MRSRSYWSFKLLLAGGHERFDAFEEEPETQANMSVPILAGAIASTGEYARRHYKSVAEDNVIHGQNAEQIENDDTLLPDNLDDFSASELRGLRRAIALRLHPDRNQDDHVSRLSYGMSEVNQRIDEAIKRKLGL